MHLKRLDHAEAAVDLSTEGRRLRQVETRRSAEARRAGRRATAALLVALAGVIAPVAVRWLNPQPPRTCAAVLADVRGLDQALHDGVVESAFHLQAMRRLREQQAQCEWR